MIVGIDFGTCFSSVSVIIDECLIKDFLKIEHSGIPSRFLHSNGINYYGEECENNANGRYEDIITDMKRDIRKRYAAIEETKKSGNKNFKISEIVELYIQYLFNTINKELKKNQTNGNFLNESIEAVAIAAPIATKNINPLSADSGKNFTIVRSDKYKSMLQEMVIKITKLDKNKVFIVEEPVAGAYSYIKSENDTEEPTIFVLDLGGGTLDTTLLVHNTVSDESTILGKGGDLELGGNDWDYELQKLIHTKYIEENGQDFELTTELQKYEFKKYTSELKIKLSNRDKAKFSMDTDGLSIDIGITRAEFEKQTKPLINRLLDIIHQTLGKYSIRDVTNFVLVGGGSNMPQIKNSILSEFDGDISEEQISIHNPSRAISDGAAYLAQMKYRTGDISFNKKVKDIATHTYGINLRPGLNSPDMKLCNLIFKNEEYINGEISKESNINVVPSSDKLVRVKFEVYESDTLKEQCNENGFIDLNRGEIPCGLLVSVDIPKRYYNHATKFQFIPKLTLDSNGILKIEVVDLNNNIISTKTAELNKTFNKNTIDL